MRWVIIRDGSASNRAESATIKDETSEKHDQQGLVRVEMSQRNGIRVFEPPGSVDIEKERRKLRVLPSYACSACSIGPQCPEFHEGYTCAYDQAFRAFPSRDLESTINLMREVVDSNTRRLRMAHHIENTAGSGLPDPNTTRLSETVMRQAQSLVELEREEKKATVTFGGAQAVEQSKPGGILARLFGGQSPAPILTEPRKEASVSFSHESPLFRGADQRG